MHLRFASELSVCRVGVATIRDELQAWSVRKSGEFVLPCLENGVAQGTKQAVSRLVSCRAFHSTSNVLQVASADAEILEQLGKLQNCGVAECLSEQADHSTWRFSQHGSANLRVAQRVHDPQRVFRPLTDLNLEALESASGWQLFAALSQQGFHVRVKPRCRKKALALPPHKPDSVNLVWCVSSASLAKQRKYMIALLHAAHLFASGILTRLHHCQPVAYYEQVLGGTHAGSALAMLEDVQPQFALTLDSEDFPGQVDRQPQEESQVPAKRRKVGQGSQEQLGEPDAKDAEREAASMEGIDSPEGSVENDDDALSSGLHLFSVSEEESGNSHSPVVGP